MEVIIKRLYIYIYMHRIELNVLRAKKYKRSTTNEIYYAAVFHTNYHKFKDFLRTHKTGKQ